MIFSAFGIHVLLAASVMAYPQLGIPIPSILKGTNIGLHQSSPKLSTIGPIGQPTGADFHSEYSTNWAGAILSETAKTVKTVTATIIVPTPRIPSGQSGAHSASAWVGIDGDTCQSAILQTGIDLSVDSTGKVSYDAWYEWYPAGASQFNDMEISPGDTITMTVTASSLTSGTATIENKSTKKIVQQVFVDQPSLCMQDAEWIVEDFMSNGSLVPFANFTTLSFTGASATSSSGGALDMSGATVVDIDQGKVLTSCSTRAAEVTCSYTG